MIGIIGAMEEEVAEILKLIDIKQKEEHYGYLFYQGLMNNKEVILLQGGIGKVNATISTSLLLTHYDVDFVINIGSAGGLHTTQNVGDVVVSKNVAHHDVDVTAFGREIGEIPGMPKYFQADLSLLEKVESILKKNKIDSHVGLIVSGDQFVAREDQVKHIQKNFPEAMCVEMEAAAIAQVCYVYHKQFIITRSLSDVFNCGNSSIQFDEYLKKASQNSAQMCFDLVSAL